MRASELLGSRVVDAAGAELGPVRDARVRVAAGSLELAAIVVGGGRLAGFAHAIGIAEGRVQGPWLLRRLCGQAIRRARVAPAEAVADWGPGVIRLTIAAHELELLGERTP